MNKEQIKTLFASVDAMDAEKFVTYLDEKAGFKFGNAATVNGRAEIKKAVAQFFGSINGLKHNIKQVWTVEDSVIIDGEVTYTRKNNTQLTIPFMNLFKMNGSLIKIYQIFIDVSPLFSA